MTSADPIETEIIRASFIAAGEHMRATMIRTAYNHIISESLDFGCALFDADVQMIAQGTGIPLFQGHLGFPIQAALEVRDRSEIQPGDIFIHNDPYSGNGNHLNDVAMFAPVFWAEELIGWVAVKAHWPDVGGAVTGSLQTNSLNVYSEGLRFQAVKLFSGGKRNEEVMRLISANVRVEVGTVKEMNAMIAVCRVGEHYFHDIVKKYGVEAVKTATRLYMDQSERRTRAALRKIANGTYSAAGYFDSDGIDHDKPVRIQVEVTVQDGSIAVNCEGTSPQVPGPFNCGDAITTSAARLVLKCLTSPLEPADEGCFRPLRVTVPKGTVLSAQEPAPTSRYAIPVVMMLELMLRALLQAIPEQIPAGSFADQMPVLITGKDHASGKLFVQGDLCGGGTGARSQRDGELGLSVFIGSTARNNPVEVVESRNPYIRILSFGLRQDSGGTGQFRGGLGTERVYYFDRPAFGTFTLERKVTPPWGVFGGGNGAINQMIHSNESGESQEIRKATHFPCEPGGTLFVRSGGGGGYGDPALRNRDAVLKDLREGYISESTAQWWLNLIDTKRPEIAAE